MRALAKALLLLVATSCACDSEPEPSPKPAARPNAKPAASKAAAPVRVDYSDKAMGTEVRFIAFTDADSDEATVRAAMKAALAEIRRLEGLMSSWRDDTEVAELNRRAGEWVKVSPETFEVIFKSVWAGRKSHGAFDITFNTLGDLWRFGDAASAEPKLPDPKQIEKRLAGVDFRKLELNRRALKVKVPEGSRIGLGGIAKGHAVDAAAAVLKKRGVTSFLVQAGGDLYGAGTKPDGSNWVSGIRDPRGPEGSFFATIPLENHAFSTAGDYARSFVVDGKRYHHIIDPKTGWPARKSRSVTVWAPDAFTADAIDDAVFVLGPEKGLELVESLDGVGAVIVAADNRVHVSKRLRGKVRITKQPTDGE